MAPARMASATTTRIREISSGRRLPLIPLVPHDEESDRAVADIAAEIEDGAAALDRGQVLAEGLEAPLDPGVEHPLGHVLDGLEGPHDRAPVAAARVGASENPQLPAMTDVTPCQHDEEREGSQKTWAS